MEHRCDRHVDVAAHEADRTKLDERMEYELTVSEVDALRETGRTGRVKRRSARVLVEIGKVVGCIACCEQRFVIGIPCEVFAWDRRIVAKPNELFDTRQLAADRAEHRKKLRVTQQDVGLGMIERVDDLLVRKSDVDHLQHRSEHRNGEVAFQIPVAIPIHDRHRSARPHAHLRQGTAQTGDPLVQRRIVVADEIAIHDLIRRSLT